MTSEKTPKTPKNAKNYYCEKCNFICSKQSEFDRHLSTRKHKTLPNTSEYFQKTPNDFICNCGKEYKHRQSLYSHKQNCKQSIENVVVQPINYQENVVVQPINYQENVVVQPINYIENIYTQLDPSTNEIKLNR